MIDLKLLRAEPGLYKQAALDKGIDLDFDRLLALDAEARDFRLKVENLRKERNELTRKVAQDADRRDENIRASRELGIELAELEATLTEIENELNRLLSFVPGLPCPAVPVGRTDEDNVEIRRVGEVRPLSETPLDHLELAQIHGMLDLEGAREVAGSRAYGLTGIGALLEMAVLRLAFEMVLTRGFSPVLPPLLVKPSAMFATGYFPLGEDNAYHFEKDDLYLTGTSEVGLAAMYTHRILEEADLPVRLVGSSTCFRREAGAAGRDTKGLYRVHQFQKVEQVIICRSDTSESDSLHEELLGNSEAILKALELPYRVVAVCTGDMGLGQVLKHDIETWMPSRNSYGETHSCSSFHDFQARRLNLRYRHVAEDENQGMSKKFAFTLNNTALASPRILIPLLENHQLENGALNIPVALRPYLGGLDTLEPGVDFRKLGFVHTQHL